MWPRQRPGHEGDDGETGTSAASRFGGAAVGWAAAWASLAALDAIWPVSNAAGVLGFALSFATLAGLVLWASLRAAQAPSGRRQVWALGLSALSLAALTLWAAPHLPVALAAAPLLLMGWVWLVAGTTVGARLGAEVGDAAHLWPLVTVGVGADLWSVTQPEGVTRQIVVEDGAPGLIDVIVLGLPVPGVGPAPILGLGDLLFTALLLGAAVRLELPVRRLITGLALGFLACLAALIITEVPLPALVFLGPLGVGALGAAARPRARDLALAVVFVGGLLALRFAVAD